MPPIKEQYFKDLGSYYDNVIEFETLRKDTTDLQEPVLLQPEPHETFESIPVQPKKEDLSYALFAKDSYNPINERTSFNNYDYLPADSTDRIATYKSDVDNELVFAIKGSNPDDPVGDFHRNSGIALGSLGTSLGLDLTGPALQQYKDHISSVRNKYLDKKVKVTGHSQGGSFANYIGIDEPDYDVITYNMGTGFPFISNSMRCRLSNCNNISNYRVVGDWSSVLGGEGTTFMLRPRIPTREIEEDAEEVEKYYIPSDVSLSHGISQFIDRDPKKLKSDYGRYGRKLAGRIGFVGGLFLPSITKSLTERVGLEAIRQVALSPEVQQRLRTPPVTPPREIPSVSQQGITGSELVYMGLKGGISKIGNLNDYLQTIIGSGLGQVAGEQFYEYVLKPSEESLAPF